MIYSKNNPFLYCIMAWYTRLLLRKHFQEIIFNAIETDGNKSILLIANHYSFWDGLILHYVNMRLLKKKMHIMILEETFKTQPFFRYANMFSVKKGSREILLSLHHAATLLADPVNLVLIYPQGKLYPNFVTRVNFQKGILNIIKKAEGNFQLVFAAAFVQYFKSTKPTATVYLKTESVNYAGKTIDDLQNAYQQHFNASKLLQTETDIE